MEIGRSRITKEVASNLRVWLRRYDLLERWHRLFKSSRVVVQSVIYSFAVCVEKLLNCRKEGRCGICVVLNYTTRTVFEEL